MVMACQAPMVLAARAGICAKGRRRALWWRWCQARAAPSTRSPGSG